MNKTEDREKLVLTKEQGKCIIFGDLKGFSLISDEITDHSRWSVTHDVIVQRDEDKKYFRGWYSVGATESQDETPFQYEDPDFSEVFAVEKTVIIYE